MLLQRLYLSSPLTTSLKRNQTKKKTHLLYTNKPKIQNPPCLKKKHHKVGLILPGMNDHHSAAAVAAGGGGVIGKHHLMGNSGNPAANLHSLQQQHQQHNQHQQQQQQHRNILSGNGGMDMQTATGNPLGLMSAYLTDDGRPPPPPHHTSMMQHNQSGREMY